MSISGTRTEREAQRGYRFSYLARKYGLSQQDARALISRIGQDRAKLNAAARAMLVGRLEAPVAKRGLGLDSPSG